MARDRFAPQPLHRYIASLIEAKNQIENTGFLEWNDLDFYNEVERGEEFFGAKGTFQCAGGIRIEVSERLRFARETRWSPRGKERRVSLIEYSYSAVLHNRGNIFRYDSPHPDEGSSTPEHHRFHHVHRFDVLGTGAEIRPPVHLDQHEVPALRQIFEEAERWHYANLERV